MRCGQGRGQKGGPDASGVVDHGLTRSYQSQWHPSIVDAHGDAETNAWQREHGLAGNVGSIILLAVSICQP
jgi:hypothetical protein